MVFPGFGVELSTVLVIDRSATAATVMMLAAVLLATFVSVGVDAVKLALSTTAPLVPGLTVAVMVKVALAALARLPTAHTPVVLSYVPVLGTEDT